MRLPRRRFSVSRPVSVVALLSLPILLLSGCFFGAGPTPTSTSTPTAEAVAAELAPYYEQVLVWTDCGDGAQCATAIAPMDWVNPTTETDITLALARHTASGTAQGSLFVNPGGPGASGYDLIHDDVDFAVGSNLQQNFDVIGWDPRGVGRSTPVTCYDDAGLDEFIFGLPTAAPEGSPQWLDEVTTTAADFGQACLANTGPVLQFIYTQSTVRDLDMLRAIVGDTTLNYLGYSYGSDIGSSYIERFPTKVGRIVLDGATDSSLSVFQVGLVQSKGFQLALENYLAACPEMFGDCPFTDGVPAALATIRELYDRYDATPLAAPDGRMMDAGVIDIAMSAALYSQDSWEFLNDLFSEAQVGVTNTAFFLADFYYGRDTDGTYLDNSFEAFLAIYCVDYPVETDDAVLAEQQLELQAASPTTYRPSPPVGDLTCINWPYQYTGPPITELTGAGAPDVLIVSTTGDPATPYEWGVALSQQLESAHLVTFDGEGHTAYNKGNDCIDSTVEDYLVSGVVPSSDPLC